MQQIHAPPRYWTFFFGWCPKERDCEYRHPKSFAERVGSPPGSGWRAQTDRMSRVSRGSGIRWVAVPRWMPPCGGIPVEGGYLGLTKKNNRGIKCPAWFGNTPKIPKEELGEARKAMRAALPCNIAIKAFSLSNLSVDLWMWSWCGLVEWKSELVNREEMNEKLSDNWLKLLKLFSFFYL